MSHLFLVLSMEAPVCFSKTSLLYWPVRAFPTCKNPVEPGAKRTLTSSFISPPRFTKLLAETMHTACWPATLITILRPVLTAQDSVSCSNLNPPCLKSFKQAPTASGS